MLHRLGDSAGPPRGASTYTSTNHGRSVGSGYPTGFHHWSTDADYDQGGRTRRNSDAGPFNQSRANSNGTRSTGKSEYADGTVSNVAGDAQCAERNRNRYDSLGHNRWGSEPVTDFGAGRTTIEFSGHAIEQSRNEPAGQLGK